VGPPAALSAPSVEDHLDVSVVAKPLEQVLVESSLMTRNEKQMSGHCSVYSLSMPRVAGHFFLARYKA